MVHARVAGGVLEVRLPAELVVMNRVRLIEAVAARLVPGIRRMRLDASALRIIDSAGLGALARVMRMCMDATGTRPQLVGAAPEIRDSMRAVLLLRHFDVQPPARERGGESAESAVLRASA
jgi:anti-anti-sigma regulatory factor